MEVTRPPITVTVPAIAWVAPSANCRPGGFVGVNPSSVPWKFLDPGYWPCDAPYIYNQSINKPKAVISTKLANTLAQVVYKTVNLKRVKTTYNHGNKN